MIQNLKRFDKNGYSAYFSEYTHTFPLSAYILYYFLLFVSIVYKYLEFNSNITIIFDFLRLFLLWGLCIIKQKANYIFRM